MAAAAVYTSSQRARAASLVENAKTWTRGTRKRDGKPFFFVPSDRAVGTVYMTAEDGCTCPAARHSRSGDCKHQQAVRQYAEQRAEALGLAGQGEIDLAFAALATSKRGNGAGAVMKRYEDFDWGD
jgi:hypothetical protein